MKLVYKMGITLGVVVFLVAGLGIAGGFSILWMRRNAAELEKVNKYSAMIEDLRAKTRQWATSAESVLTGEGSKDFFHFSTLLLEERLSSLLNQPIPGDELKLVEVISSHFYKARPLLEGLLAKGENPQKNAEVIAKVDQYVREISRNVEVLVNSHRIYTERVTARVNRTEDIGKCVSLAVPSTTILLSILLVLTMGRTVINSVGTLVSATRTMAGGDLSKPIGLKTGDEFGEIANAFEEMRKELRQKEQKLEQLSITDALTGLFNRRYMSVKLEEEIARAKRFHHLLSVVFIDIDSFKKYNDRYGHLEGDKVLNGGEEFLLIVPESSTLQALTVSERILQGFSSKPFLPKDPAGGEDPGSVHVTFSAGVATLKDHDDDSEKLLHRADQAMFQAKSQGRNRIVTV